MSLFPLDTLVRDGITKAAGYHWPALYFLSGLTKLTSVPVELLKTCLAAADNELNEEDTKTEIEEAAIFITSSRVSWFWSTI